MRKLPQKTVLAVSAFILLFTVCGSPQKNMYMTDRPTDVVTGLSVPWSLDFLPGGIMIFTERQGNIRTFSFKEKHLTDIGFIQAANDQEAGLLGIAADPDFISTKYIYLYYTYSTDGGMFNRVTRFTFFNTLENEAVLLDSIPASPLHNGGRLKFGPDGTLYITTGDAQNPQNSSDKKSLAGKILRINRDGTIPQDNPFGNAVWALGLRNPQGLAWDKNGTLYASDHGPEMYDAIRKIERGQNYGWPSRKCDETPAVRCYTDLTLAPSGIAIIGDTLYAAGLKGKQLRRINLTTNKDNALLTEYGRLRDAVVHEGALYITTSNRDGRGTPQGGDDRIIRYPFMALSILE
ncbi:MAG: PQQ-dependent sugar dehydrogenase [Chitinispirillales bacterium]|nr:PQQ-dependent sugar dehydrogenase [Chitinispirillales bacterium]